MDSLQTSKTKTKTFTFAQDLVASAQKALAPTISFHLYCDPAGQKWAPKLLSEQGAGQELRHVGCFARIFFGCTVATCGMPLPGKTECILTGFHFHSCVEGSWQASLSIQILRPRLVGGPILLGLLAISSTPRAPLHPVRTRLGDGNGLPSSLTEPVTSLSITCILHQSHHKSTLNSIWRCILLPKPSLVAGMGQGGSLAFTPAVVTHPLGRTEGFVLGCGGAAASVAGNTAALCSLALAPKVRG